MNNTQSRTRENLNEDGFSERGHYMNQERMSALKNDAQDEAKKVGEGVQEKAHEVGAEAQDFAHKLKKSVTETAEDVRQVAEEKGAELRDASKRQVDAIEQRIKHDPLRSVLIASGLGFVLGAMWRRS